MTTGVQPICSSCFQRITNGPPLRHLGSNWCPTSYEERVGPLPLSPEEAAARAEAETRARFHALAEAAPQGNRLVPEGVILTTAPSLEGYRVTRTLAIVTAECAFGMNIFRDLFAGLTDIFSGRSEATQKVLRDARQHCLEELRREAIRHGANAVIAVDLDYSEFSGQGKSMLFLVASGTAVFVEPLDAETDR